MATVELRGLAKRLGDHLAVDDLSLQVRDGDCLALLGPSGCGKSTTLNLIAGFLSPDVGEIVVDGQVINGVAPDRRNMGMVFQNYALFPHMTVAENVAFGLEMRGIDKNSRLERVSEVLELVHLGGLNERLPRELSGGQQQRAALARALAIRPALLLLDEPLSNLDARLRAVVRDEIAEIQRRLKLTTIFVTHDQEEALAIADQVAVMRDGRILQVGTSTEIYSHPSDTFVATFIGDSNIFDGELLAGDSEVRAFAFDAGIMHVHAPSTAREPQAKVLVRPEDVLVSTLAPTDYTNCFEGRVEGRTFLGSVTRYTIEIGGVVVTAVAQGSNPAAPSIGDRIWVAWQPQDARLLQVTQ